MICEVCTYVSTIAGTDDQTTVQAELHVARARGLGTSRGDVLGDVTGGRDDFSLADIVVFQEDDLEQVANIGIVVHNVTDLVDEVDDSLSHPVSRRSLATENGHARSELLPLFRGQGLDLEVPVDDTEDVELLAFILVDTLDLNIEERSGVDRDTIVLFDVLRKPDLVRVFDFAELLSELLIVDKSLKLAKQSEVLQEVVATELRGDERRKTRVGLMQPPSWCDTIRHISELVRSVDLDEILEDGSLDQVGVQLSNTVNLVRANQRKVGHANHLRV